MPEPFKNLFNITMIGEMAGHLVRVAPDFDQERFVALASDGLEGMELKQRAGQITGALDACLPRDFPAAAAVLRAALHPETEVDLSGRGMDGRGIRGWAVMPMADHVAARGLDDFELGLDVLGEMTMRFSAEFAVRPFLIHDPERGMARMRIWAGSGNFHQRRLASEGCRPRLPWGLRLRPFVEDPEPVIALLGMLRDDPSDYVRRSVANNLNDIAKDHPDRIAALAAEWLVGAGPERLRLVRHACRGLIKQGHAGILGALGYAPPELCLEELVVSTPIVRFGEGVTFEITLRSEAAVERRIVLDYAIHHRKAKGGTSPKVFKWRDMVLAPGARVTLNRHHAMRPITTRVYRDGGHAVEIIANGVSLGLAAFELVGVEG